MAKTATAPWGAHIKIPSLATPKFLTAGEMYESLQEGDKYYICELNLRFFRARNDGLTSNPDEAVAWPYLDLIRKKHELTSSSVSSLESINDVGGNRLFFLKCAAPEFNEQEYSQRNIAEQVGYRSLAALLANDNHLSDGFVVGETIREGVPESDRKYAYYASSDHTVLCWGSIKKAKIYPGYQLKGKISAGYCYFRLEKNKPLEGGKKSLIEWHFVPRVLKVIELAPTSELVRGLIMQAVKTQPPEEAKTFDELKNWIEMNFYAPQDCIPDVKRTPVVDPRIPVEQVEAPQPIHFNISARLSREARGRCVYVIGEVCRNSFSFDVNQLRELAPRMTTHELARHLIEDIKSRDNSFSRRSEDIMNREDPTYDEVYFEPNGETDTQLIERLDSFLAANGITPRTQ